jgi:hypothetical protein
MSLFPIGSLREGACLSSKKESVALQSLDHLLALGCSGHLRGAAFPLHGHRER